MAFPVAAVLASGLAGLVGATWLGSAAARLGFPVPDERRRLGAIDGLRGYLALLVMVHHFATYLLLSTDGGGWRDADAPVLRNFGGGSVALFFMITGALFFPKTWGGVGGNDWRSMYLSRVFRILPLQIVAVAAIALVAWTRVDAIGDSWISFPARFALWLTCYSQPMLFGYRGSAMVNAFVLWSLWVEWRFYLLVLPPVALAIGLLGARRGRWLVPAALLASGIAIRYGGDPALARFNQSIFACGMLALLARESRLAPFLRGPAAALIAGVALALVVAILPEPDRALPLAVYTLFFACVICGNRFGGLLATRGALVLGEASFSIYMLHGVLLNIVFVSGGALVAAVPVAARPWLLAVLIPAMSLVAIATYLLVERPMIGIGRRLAAQWRRVRGRPRRRRRWRPPRDRPGDRTPKNIRFHDGH